MAEGWAQGPTNPAAPLQLATLLSWAEKQQGFIGLLNLLAPSRFKLFGTICIQVFPPYVITAGTAPI